MDLDAKTVAIFILVCAIVGGLIWDALGDGDDIFDDFWEPLDREDDEVDEEDDRHQSGKN